MGLVVAECIVLILNVIGVVNKALVTMSARSDDCLDRFETSSSSSCRVNNLPFR